MPKITVITDVATKGWNGPGDDGEDVYWWQVWDLEDALNYEFDSDAHFLPYRLDGEDYCPRLNSKAFEAANPVYDVIVWDVDGKHNDWYVPGSNVEILSRVPRWFGWYETKNGWRLWVQPKEPLKWTEYAEHHTAGREYLEGLGVHVDQKTSDITRVYRLPNVMRDGEHLHGVWMPPAGPPDLGPRASSTSSIAAARGVAAICSGEPDEVSWEAPSRLGAGERNSGLFSMGGYLLGRGLPHDVVQGILEVMNERICDPPLDEGELALLISSLDRYETGDIRVMTFARPGNAIHLRTGSELEIAEMGLQILDSRAEDYEVVSVDGELWRWDAPGWRKCDAEFRKAIMGMDGATYGDGQKPGRLRLTARTIKGAVEAAHWARTRNDDGGFFRPGMVIDGKVNGRPVLAADRIRWAIPGPVGGSRTCLEEVLGRQFGSLDDRRARLLQEFCGAALHGESWQHQRALVLLGGGANGKSAFLEGLVECFPSGAVSHVGPHLWDGPHLASLAGAYLNLCMELPSRKLADTAVFKSVVACEPVPCRRLYESPFLLRPQAGQLFSANELPPASNLPDGFWRRWFVLEWPVQIPEAERDPDFVRRLKAERAGVLEWLIEGADRLRERGRYDVPQSMTDTLGEWKVESDPVSMWLEDRRNSSKFSVGSHIDNQKLFMDYRLWCAENNVKNVPNSVWFSRRLAKSLERQKKGGSRGFLWS